MNQGNFGIPYPMYPNMNMMPNPMPFSMNQTCSDKDLESKIDNLEKRVNALEKYINNYTSSNYQML